MLGNVLGMDIAEGKTNQSLSSTYFLIGSWREKGQEWTTNIACFVVVKAMEKIKQSKGFMDVYVC